MKRAMESGLRTEHEQCSSGVTVTGVTGVTGGFGETLSGGRKRTSMNVLQRHRKDTYTVKTCTLTVEV